MNYILFNSWVIEKEAMQTRYMFVNMMFAVVRL